MISIIQKGKPVTKPEDATHNHLWRCLHCGATASYNHNQAPVVAGQRVESSRPLKVESPELESISLELQKGRDGHPRMR